MELIMAQSKRLRSFGPASSAIVAGCALILSPMAPHSTGTNVAAAEPPREEKTAYPVVISTSPKNGDVDVDPGHDTVTITFDRDMGKGMSWTGDIPVDRDRKVRWRDDRTCELPVKLEKGKTYRIGINAPSYKNFASKSGEPTPIAAIYFTTQGAAADAKPRATEWPIVSLEPDKGGRSATTKPAVGGASALAPLDVEAATAEVSSKYGKAHPEVQEFVLHTATSFGRSGLWLNENAFASMKPADREARVKYLAKLFEEAEYGRHLCSALAEASALKDPALVPGLKKVAAYHVDGRDYDCRAKWMAVAALARQESPDAVPVLVSLVDHGNQNTRLWARAALARMANDDFKTDKQAWNKWSVSQGHDEIPADLLKPYTPPVQK